MPASIWGLFVWLQQASDKWALNYFSGAEFTSQYAILYQIVYMPFSMGIGVILMLFTPIIYQSESDKIIKLLLELKRKNGHS